MAPIIEPSELLWNRAPPKPITAVLSEDLDTRKHSSRRHLLGGDSHHAKLRFENLERLSVRFPLSPPPITLIYSGIGRLKLPLNSLANRHIKRHIRGFCHLISEMPDGQNTTGLANRKILYSPINCDCKFSDFINPLQRMCDVVLNFIVSIEPLQLGHHHSHCTLWQ